MKAAGWTCRRDGWSSGAPLLNLSPPLFWGCWPCSGFLRSSCFTQEGKVTFILELISSFWKAPGRTWVERSCCGWRGVCSGRSSLSPLRQWACAHCTQWRCAHLPSDPSSPRSCCSEPGDRAVASGSTSQDCFPHGLHPSSYHCRWVLSEMGQEEILTVQGVISHKIRWHVKSAMWLKVGKFSAR